jgi:hypothetical protein
MLFLRGVPIAQCIQLFDDLVLKLFDPFQSTRNIFKRLRLLFRGWYLDGHYDTGTLEDNLKNTFGSQNRMFGYQGGVLSAKVGVVAATIGKADPVIFTNYNGTGRSQDCGIVHI